jgi:hypothetical protein
MIRLIVRKNEKRQHLNSPEINADHMLLKL